MKNNLLVPEVKHFKYKKEYFVINKNTVISKKKGLNIEFIPELKEHILSVTGIKCALKDGRFPYNSIYLEIVDNIPEVKNNKEGYTIEINKDRIILKAIAPNGLFYAVCTLKQLIAGSKVRSCIISDHPDYPFRGVSIATNRGRVPTVEYLKKMIRVLSSYKANALTLYMEHTFKFKKHPLIGKGCSSLSASDIKEVSRYAKQYYVDLFPSFQSFGHYANVLNLKKYEHLSESYKNWTLSPSEPGTYKLLKDLYQEINSAFDSKYFNICCDETYDLGDGKSAGTANKIGIGGLYLKHINKIRKMLEEQGKTVMMWFDIFLSKGAEVIDKVPKNIIMLNWNYYRRSEGYPGLKTFHKAGLKQMVCPSNQAYARIFPNLEWGMANIESFLIEGKKYNVVGALNTDWGDGGHLNMPELAWHGHIFFCDAAWNTKKKDAESFHKNFCRLFLDEDSPELVKSITNLGELNYIHSKNKKDRPSISIETRRLFEDKLLSRRIFEFDTSAAKKLGSEAETCEKVLLKYLKIVKFNKGMLEEAVLAAGLFRFISRKVLFDRKLPFKRDYGEAFGVHQKKSNKTQLLALYKELNGLIKDLKSLEKEYCRLWMKTSRISNLRENKLLPENSALNDFKKNYNDLCRMSVVLKRRLNKNIEFLFDT